MKRFIFPLVLTVIVAITGVSVYRNAESPSAIDVKTSDPGKLGVDFDPSQPRHLVTRAMEVETRAMTQRVAPPIVAKDTYGTKVDVQPGMKAPALVLFIKSGCPCSIDAQPLFNRLAQRYQGKIQTVGIIDGDGPGSQSYATQFKVAFPVIADPKLSLIHAYRAKASVYSALVARNGHIIRMWPGYSADLLREIDRTMADSVGMKMDPFDPQYAPTKKAAGCAFPD
jgi:peroxiredoxin